MALTDPERLFRAAQSGDRRTVAALIADDTPTDWVDADGMTPLLASLRAGRPDIAKLLIAAEADTKAVDKLGRGPMHHAAATPGCLTLNDPLFAAMATNARDSTGAAPLHRACHSAVGPLIRCGAAVREIRDAKNRTPLMRAAAEGRVSALLALLGQDCDPEAVDDQGRTALRLVAGTKNGTAAVAVLASRSWTPAAANDGTTALHAAVAASGPEGYLQSVILIMADADVRAVDRKGRSPLHAVNFVRGYSDGVALGETLQLVALLAAHGADLNAVDEAGETPLHIASGSAPPEVLAALAALGADPCRRNAKGEPAWPQRAGELEAQAKAADEAKEAAPKLSARPFGPGLRRYVPRTEADGQ